MIWRILVSFGAPTAANRRLIRCMRRVGTCRPSGAFNSDLNVEIWTMWSRNTGGKGRPLAQSPDLNMIMNASDLISH